MSTVQLIHFYKYVDSTQDSTPLPKKEKRRQEILGIRDRLSRPNINPGKSGRTGYNGGQLELECNADSGIKLSWKLPNDNAAIRVRIYK